MPETMDLGVAEEFYKRDSRKHGAVGMEAIRNSSQVSLRFLCVVSVSGTDVVVGFFKAWCRKKNLRMR